MNQAKEAFIWITGILKEKQIPFQITGGLAAIAYGANRSLADIDIDIPDDQFNYIINDVKPYIIFGPARFKSEKWDLMLMTLNYRGQEIDLSGGDSTHILNAQTGEWIKLNEDVQSAPVKKIFDLDLPIIPIENLIFYKKTII